ncbi:uncharacterized protein LOC119110483 [Pollicipes pollicipes]|nr:uncharacterized protein LOC119110483 [Pollicipes pollicipes]
MTHNSSVLLYRAGQQASGALQLFAEKGDSAGLETNAQGDLGVLDQFTAPAVTQGEGTTHSQLFVDGVHSKVSMISKIVPSPDWFIGIDSLELCEDGHWIDTLDVKLFPMDAGTDQGLAFTSPNWESVPHEPIYQITSRRPDHPASSFQYPDLDALPPLASLHIFRVRSYKLAHEFHQSNTVVYTVDTAPPEKVQIVTTTQRSVQLPGIQLSTQSARPPPAGAAARHADGSLSQVALRSDGEPTKIDGLRLKVVRADELSGVKVRNGDRQAIIEKITSHYHHKRRKSRRRRRKHLKRKRGPRNCSVGPWSDWGRCSRACGIGEMTRTRQVTRHARRGGKPCPPLEQRRWCGSARSCDKRYFNW